MANNIQELFGSLPRVSETIRARRLRFAGHCACHNEENASKVLLWEPQNDKELHTLTPSRLTQDWTIPKR